MDSKLKLVIIGSGPAAFTAAIYAARAELKPLVLAGEQSGGQLMLTTKVENFPGFADAIMGPDLMAAMRKQAEKLGVEIIDKNATSLSVIGSQFSVISSESTGFQSVSPEPVGRQPTNLNPKTDLPAEERAMSRERIVREAGEWQAEAGNGKQITARSVIIATGALAITLNLPGENRFMGRGVGTCAVCDAPFYKGKDTVFIIGGGDSAIEEASEISKFASKVIILVRKESLRATPILRKRIEATQNIEIWYKSQALELLGDKRLEKVKINKDGTIAEFPADGLFYAIGHTPATGWLQGSGVKLNEKGYILTSLSGTISNKTVDNRKWKIGAEDRKLKMEIFDPSSTVYPLPLSSILNHPSSNDTFPTMTSIPGIFAAGDCVDFRYRQAIVAAGFGAMAALDCQQWLESQ